MSVNNERSALEVLEENDKFWDELFDKVAQAVLKNAFGEMEHKERCDDEIPTQTR